MNTKFFFQLTCALLIATFGVACSDDDNNTPADGDARVTFEITDAPVDDVNIQGVFITVAELKAGGNEVDLAGKQTFEISALTKGQTRSLGTADLEAGAYQSLELVLDAAQDAGGNSPGCYVLTTDGIKHPLTIAGQTNGLVRFTTQTGGFTAEAGESVTAVIDLDLRKAIRYEAQPVTTDKYNFNAAAELTQALRVVAKDKTGSIKGSVENAGLEAGSKVVVYAYKKGAFTQAEVQPRGEGQVRFRNAVTSSLVGSDNKYTLAFLQEGDYEVVLASYKDEDNDGDLEYKGLVNASLLGSLNLNLTSINVSANASVDLGLRLIGLKP